MKLRACCAVTLILIATLASAACDRKRAIRENAVTGLGAVADQSVASSRDGAIGGLIGGREGPGMAAKVDAFVASPEDKQPLSPDRKIVRTGSLELVVDNVPQSLQKLRQATERLGGYIENSSLSGGGSSATISVRVPADRLDEAIAVFKALAAHVDQETLQAQDVTRQYIDLDARLRNAQAEEAQYLQIMKRAATVKDTLKVAEKLSDVRGRIEQMQGEMHYMTQQIAMSALQISLGTEADTRVLGIRWRPLRQAHAAFYGMLQGLADWADWAISFVIDLPLIVLWLATIIGLAFVSWRVLRAIWRFISGRTGWKLPSLRLRKPKADTVS